MKKLLAILGAVGLTASASSAVVACGNVQIDTTSNFNLLDGTVTSTLTEGLKFSNETDANNALKDTDTDVSSMFTLEEGSTNTIAWGGKNTVAFTADTNAKASKSTDGSKDVYTVKGTITVTFTPTETVAEYGNSGQNSYFTYNLKGKDDANKDLVEPITFHLSKTTLDFNKMADSNKTIVFDQDMLTQKVAKAAQKVGDKNIAKGDKIPVDLTADLATGIKLETKDGKDVTASFTGAKAMLEDYGSGKKALSDEVVVTLNKALDKGDYKLVIDETNPIFIDGTITFSVK